MTGHSLTSALLASDSVDVRVAELNFAINGWLFVNTDGLMENIGPDEKNLTQRRLKSLLQSSRTHKPEKATQVVYYPTSKFKS